MELFKVESRILKVIFCLCFFYLVMYLNNFYYTKISFKGINYYLLAPILEESFRALSVLMGFPLLYTLFLAITEFIIYILAYASIDDSLTFIFLRILCILNHLLYFFIQVTSFNIAKRNNNVWVFILGYFAAISVHFLWNSKFSGIVVNFLYGG